VNYRRQNIQTMGLNIDILIQYQVEDDGYIEVTSITAERIHVAGAQKRIVELSIDCDLAALTPSEWDYIDSTCRQDHREKWADAQLEAFMHRTNDD